MKDFYLWLFDAFVIGVCLGFFVLRPAAEWSAKKLGEALGRSVTRELERRRNGEDRMKS